MRGEVEKVCTGCGMPESDCNCEPQNPDEQTEVAFDFDEDEEPRERYGA